MIKKVKVTYIIEKEDREKFFNALKEKNLSLRKFSKKTHFSLAYISDVFASKRSINKQLMNYCKLILGIDFEISYISYEDNHLFS